MPREPLIIPALRYSDAPAAIDFLCRAFGFTRHAVYADENNPAIVHHAELCLGKAMVMLGSVVPDPSQKLYGWKTPKEAGGVTCSLYCVVDDLDAHYERAKAAGADIITVPRANEGYPGRSYNARDPEGYNWGFGTYDPLGTN